LERELAPFVEQARDKARATVRATARDDESELSDLRSSDFGGLDETSGQDGRVGDKEVEVEAPASPASPASPAPPASPASPALQLRPKRSRVAPARYRD
jgi:hypothetical protein